MSRPEPVDQQRDLRTNRVRRFRSMIRNTDTATARAFALLNIRSLRKARQR